MKKINRHNMRKLSIKIKSIFIILIIITIFILFFKDLNKKIERASKDLLRIKSKSMITRIVDTTLSDLLKSRNLKSSDLYTSIYNSNGDLLQIDIDTLLINDMCNVLSENISTEFTTNKSDVIVIPILSLYNFNIPTKFSPTISSSIIPIGNVDVSYDTSFTSAGINQTKFELWLTVDCQLQTANPLTDEVFIENRRIPLISTIINGNVPTYLNNPMQ